LHPPVVAAAAGNGSRSIFRGGRGPARPGLWGPPRCCDTPACRRPRDGRSPPTDVSRPRRSSRVRGCADLRHRGGSRWSAAPPPGPSPGRPTLDEIPGGGMCARGVVRPQAGRTAAARCHPWPLRWGRGKDATGDEVAAGGVRREARSAGSTSPPIVGGRGVRYGPAVLRVAHAPRACSTDRASRPDRGGPDRTPNQQAAPLPRRLSLARAQRTAGGGPAGRGSPLPNPAPTAPTWCGRRDHRRCPCAATR
jgi:hypothetical protein